MRAKQSAWALLGVLLLLPARDAAAQPPLPTGGVEPVTLTFGTLKIAPMIVLRNMGVDDNVFNDTENPKRDFTFTLTPRANVTFEPGRLRASFTTATDYVYFRRYASERGVNETAGGRLEADLGLLRPWVDVSGVNTRERTSPEIDARARHHDLTYSAGTALRFGSRSSFSVAMKRVTTSFDAGASFRGQELAAVLNSQTDTVEGGLSVDLTPFTSVTLTAGHDRQRFDFTPERNSTSLRVTPTVSFHPGGLLAGSLGIGVRRFHSTERTMPDYSGLVAQGDVTTTLGGRYRLAFGVLRDVRYSYDATTPYYLLTNLTGTVQTQLTTGWDVVAMATRQLLDYRARAAAAADAPGPDRGRTLGTGLGYHLKPTLRLGVQADWTRRTSPRDATRSYTDRRVFSTITWGAAQ